MDSAMQDSKKLLLIFRFSSSTFPEDRSVV